LYEVTPSTVFDEWNKHLEYYPIVNQRVFKIGKGESSVPTEDENQQGKEILNVQFKATYKRLLHLILH